MWIKRWCSLRVRRSGRARMSRGWLTDLSVGGRRCVTTGCACCDFGCWVVLGRGGASHDIGCEGVVDQQAITALPTHSLTYVRLVDTAALTVEFFLLRPHELRAFPSTACEALSRPALGSKKQYDRARPSSFPAKDVFSCTGHLCCETCSRSRGDCPPALALRAPRRG